MRERSEDCAPSRLHGLFPILVAAAGVTVYLNSLSAPFLFDTRRVVLLQPRIRQVWPLRETMSGSRPVTDLTLAVNYAIGGSDDPSGYRVVNIGVHVLAALTLFGIVRRTLLQGGLRRRFGAVSPWLALIIALIWVLHPLQTQSVTYIIQRSESLMGLFYLLALYCLIRGVGSPRPRWWYMVAVAFCAAGMGSKAVMVTAPLVMLLYDRTFLSGSFRDALRKRWGLYAALLGSLSVLWVCGIVGGVLDPSVRKGASVGFGYKGIAPLAYAATQPGVLLHYLRLALVPHHLCLDYGWPVARTFRAVVPSALVIAALLSVTAWALRNAPALGFVCAWFFLILAPTSSIVPINDPLFEHRMYLPLASVVVLAVIGGHGFLEYVSGRFAFSDRLRRSLAVVLTLAVAGTLGFRTVWRNHDYRSRVAMWSDVAAQRPLHARAHFNLGAALLEENMADKAIDALRTGFRLERGFAKPYVTLGRALQKQGRIDEAIDAYREAIRLKPKPLSVYLHLGAAFAQQGRTDEAIRAYRQAVQIEPESAEAQLTLGNALLKQGKSDEAVRIYREAIRIRPEYPEAYGNLGGALSDLGDLGQAIDAFRTALRMDPAFAEAHHHLGRVLVKQGRIDEGVRSYHEALRIKPLYPEARHDLGLALQKQGLLDEAIREFRRVLEKKPKFYDAYNNLGVALGMQGKLGEAIEVFRTVLGIEPDLASAHYNLGHALRKQGKVEDAIREYRQTLRIDPDHAGARKALETTLARTRRSTHE